LGVAGGARVEGADDRVAAGFGLDQARLLQPGQRLAHRGPADAQPLDQVGAVEPLTGGERAVDDGVPDRPVSVFAQQRRGDEPATLRNRHATYWTARF